MNDPFIHHTHNKNGFVDERGPNLEQDYEDACVLLSVPAWNRYWIRKLNEKRNLLSKGFESVESNDISEFKKIQAKIELLDEIIRIPAIDVKNLRK